MHYGRQRLTTTAVIAVCTKYSELCCSNCDQYAQIWSHHTSFKRWLPVATQLYFRNAIMAFKCLTSCVPEYLSSQFIKRGDISGRTTRNSQMLNIPLFKTASGQRTFYYRIVSIWNSMDCSLKTLESKSAFKFNLRQGFYGFLSILSRQLNF